jgi:hypothetical protein
MLNPAHYIEAIEASHDYKSISDRIPQILFEAQKTAVKARKL